MAQVFAFSQSARGAMVILVPVVAKLSSCRASLQARATTCAITGSDDQAFAHAGVDDAIHHPNARAAARSPSGPSTAGASVL